MPAAAVIPAPLAYTIIVAVKRLVVGLNCRLKYFMRVILLFATHVCSVTHHIFFFGSAARACFKKCLEFRHN